MYVAHLSFKDTFYGRRIVDQVVVAGTGVNCVCRSGIDSDYRTRLNAT